MNDESKTGCHNESGFTLIETVIALVILMVAVLGVFSAFTYSIRWNSGNSSRSQALSVLQREVESLRSAKFTPTITDNVVPIDLTGGVKADRTVTASNGTGFTYTVQTTVDDDPFTAGVQTVVAPATTTMKEITIVVTPQGTSQAWVTAYPVRAVFRRVRSN